MVTITEDRNQPTKIVTLKTQSPSTSETFDKGIPSRFQGCGHLKNDHSQMLSPFDTKVNHGLNLSHFIPFDFSLSSTRLHSERSYFYITHWEKQCLSSLSSTFAQLSLQLETCQILHDAVLAFAACNMSRMHSELKYSNNLRDRDLKYRPHLMHYMYSQMYYNSAIRRLARLSSAEYRNNMHTLLPSLLLFCYMESSICNFRGYLCHVDGISIILELAQGDIESRPNGSDVIAIWEQLRLYTWWIRAHFCTLNFQSSKNVFPISLPYHDLRAIGSTSRTAIISLLCESYRLSSVAFLRWWDYHNSHSGGTNSSLNTLYQENDMSLLLQLSTSLDEWESQLGRSEQPSENSLIDSKGVLDANMKLKPLQFQSHKAATNYAYYTATRIMHCFLVSSHNLATGDQRPIESGYWTNMLLSVIYGMKHSDCARENVYTIGVSGLLLACILRSTDQATGVAMEIWLKQFQQNQIFEEGSLPVSQIVAIVGMINRQRTAGYDIFAISPENEDDGSDGKFDSYNNQTLSNVLVYGRHRHTGNAFSARVPLVKCSAA